MTLAKVSRFLSRNIRRCHLLIHSHRYLSTLLLGRCVHEMSHLLIDRLVLRLDCIGHKILSSSRQLIKQLRQLVIVRTYLLPVGRYSVGHCIAWYLVSLITLIILGMVQAALILEIGVAFAVAL